MSTLNYTCPPPLHFQTACPQKAARSRTKKPVNNIANLVEFSERLFTHATKPPTRTCMISSPNVRKRVCLSIWCARKDSGLNRTFSWCRGLHSAFVEEIVALMNCLVFICLYQHLLYIIHTLERYNVSLRTCTIYRQKVLIELLCHARAPMLV